MGAFRRVTEFVKGLRKDTKIPTNQEAERSNQLRQEENKCFEELLDAVVGDIVVTYIDPKTGLRTTEQQLFPPSTTPSKKS